MRSKMRKQRTARLNVLALEDRLTPTASVVFSGGNLTITGDNTPTSVFITNSDFNTGGAIAGAPGSYRVFVVKGDQLGVFTAAGGDPAAFETKLFSRGNYQLTRTLTVNMGNSDDLVVLTMQDGTSLPGNFNVSLGNSGDTLQVQTRNNAQAKIAGSTTVNGGNGADNVFLFDIRFQGIVQINGGTSG